MDSRLERADGMVRITDMRVEQRLVMGRGMLWTIERQGVILLQLPLDCGLNASEIFGLALRMEDKMLADMMKVK